MTWSIEEASMAGVTAVAFAFWIHAGELNSICAGVFMFALMQNLTFIFNRNRNKKDV